MALTAAERQRRHRARKKAGIQVKREWVSKVPKPEDVTVTQVTQLSRADLIALLTEIADRGRTDPALWHLVIAAAKVAIAAMDVDADREERRRQRDMGTGDETNPRILATVEELKGYATQ